MDHNKIELSEAEELRHEPLSPFPLVFWISCFLALSWLVFIFLGVDGGSHGSH